jgi:cysteine desulfurase / selenocysteine lyase
MDVRHHFPHTERLNYLDHAATGPLSKPALDALEGFLRDKHLAEPNNYAAIGPRLASARARLAAVIGAAPERVELVPNTSYGLNVLAQGLDWRDGDRVAVPACEFPANVMPWKGLASRGVALDLFPHERGTFSLADVERALTPRTRVLSISWVQFLSGFRADLGAIGQVCRQRGVLLCVDAIQGLGALRLDVRETPVDFIASGAQKWLMGLPGTGMIYLTEELQEQLTPVRGWLNGPVDFDDLLSYDLELLPDAARFRQGTLAMGDFVALDAALGLYLDAGIRDAEARVLELARLAADHLRRLGLRRFGSDDPAHGSGIVTVEHPRPEALLAAFHDAGVRASVRNGMVRLAPTWYNTPAEVEHAVAIVRQTI